jgi:Tfp pilus assembly protein PilV
MTPKFRKFLHSRHGLSLPEVLVTCFITVTGLSALLSSFLGGRLASTGAKHWTQAMNLARARIENLKSLPYADLSSMPSATSETGMPLDERDGGGSVRCSRITTLTQQDDGIDITVMVTWDEKEAGAGFVPWIYQLKTWVGFPGSPSGGGGLPPLAGT